MKRILLCAIHNTLVVSSLLLGALGLVQTVTDVYKAPPQATSGPQVDEVGADDLIGVPTPAKKPRAPRKALSVDDLIG